MLTREAIHQTGRSVDNLDLLDLEVPTIDTAFLQGDVTILRRDLPPATTRRTGDTVVQSGNGGHDHTITGRDYHYTPGTADDTMTMLGTLTVPDGTTVLLGHPEHGYAEILPGTYRVGGQREYAAEWRAVTD